jgi:hypothetical protein
MSFGFDPSIILAASKASEGTFGDTLQQLASIKAQQAQQQHAQATLGELLRKQQQEQTLADIVRSNADTPQNLPLAYRRGGFGAQADAAEDQRTQMASQEALRGKLFRENQEAHRKHVGELFYGANTAEKYAAARQELASNPDPMLAIYAAKIPEAFDPAVAERLGNLAVPAEKRATIKAMSGVGSRVEVDENGNAFVVNPRTPEVPAAPVMAPDGSQLKKRVPGKGGGGGGGGAGGAAGGGLSEQALEDAVDAYKTSGQLPQLGQGKVGAVLKLQIMNRAAEKYAGTNVAASRADYKANTETLQALQKQSAFVDQFESTAEKNLDLFVDRATKTLVDTGSPLLNTPVRDLKKRFSGDPELAALDALRQTAIAEVSKVLSGNTGSAGATEGVRHEAAELMRSDATVGQIIETAKALKQDMANRKAAVAKSIEEARARISGKPAEKEGAHPKDSAAVEWAKARLRTNPADEKAKKILELNGMKRWPTYAGRDEGASPRRLESRSCPGTSTFTRRPVVRNADGTISTVRSMSTNIDGREVLLPTVSDDGKILSDDDAIKLYRKTGKHLGMFRTPDEATAYAQRLHEEQANEYGAGGFDPDAYLAEKAPPINRRPFDRARRKIEDEKLFDSLGPAERLWLGLGKGAHNVALNVEDVVGRLTGKRPDPTAWADGQSLTAPLSSDFLGSLGEQVGTLANVIPAGVAAGAATTAALPAWAIAAAPTLASGAEGLVMNALGAGPGQRGEAAQTGLTLGMGIPAALKAAGTFLPGPLKWAGTTLAQLLMPGTSATAREAALGSGAVRMGRTAEDVAERLAAESRGAGANITDVLTQMEAGGGRGVEVGPLHEALLARGREVAPMTTRPAVANAYPRAASRIADVAEEQPAYRLGLNQGEALKRSFQEGIPYGRPGAKEAVRTQKDIASMFREAQEQAVAEAAVQNPELASLAAQYIPAKQRAGFLIEAAKAAGKAAKPGLYGRMGDLMALGSSATAGMTHHGPMGALWALPGWAAEHLARTRGASTLAAGSYGLGRWFEGLGQLRPLSPQLTAPLLSLAPRDNGFQAFPQFAFGNGFRRPQAEAP